MPITPNQIEEKFEKDFDKWAEETTATIMSVPPSTEDDYGEDYNLQFSELDFYEELKKKVFSVLHTQRAEDREETGKAIIDTAYLLGKTQIELYNGQLPFVIFKGTASEEEKVSIYRQGIEDFLKHLQKALSTLDITKE